MLKTLTDTYIELLKLAPDDLFRIRNQSLYAAVRDAIAYQTNLSPENVQLYFEDYIDRFSE